MVGMGRGKVQFYMHIHLTVPPLSVRDTRDTRPYPRLPSPASHVP